MREGLKTALALGCFVAFVVAVHWLAGLMIPEGSPPEPITDAELEALDRQMERELREIRREFRE